MTEYQNYKNKIQDIKYIFNSGNVEILDLQYILILIYESVFNISIDLQEEVKNIFNQIDFSDNDLNMDINNPAYYFYIFSLIKNDLNKYNLIQENTRKLMVELLSEIDNIIPKNENVSDNLSNVKEECQGFCGSCNIKCYEKQPTDYSVKQDTSFNTEQNLNYESEPNKLQQYEHNNILKDKILNSKYLKDYLIHNNLILNECHICGLNSWQNNYLSLQLDYIDLNEKNQDLSNLRLLCPNCFSQVGYK